MNIKYAGKICRSNPFGFPKDGRKRFRTVLCVDQLAYYLIPDEKGNRREHQLMHIIANIANACSKFGYTLKIKIAPVYFTIETADLEKVEVRNEKGNLFIATFDKTND